MTEQQRVALFNELKSLELSFEVSVASLNVFVGTMQFGINETSRLGAAISYRLKNSASSAEGHYQRIAQGMIDGLSKQGLAVATAWGNYEEESAKNRAKLHEMALVSLVALFDAFVADALATVLRARPEKLRSNKKSLNYEKILNLASRDEIVQFMIDKEVNEFAYESVKTKWEHYEERFDIKIDKTSVDLDELADIMGQRNLLAHNNGIANKRYLEIVPRPTLKLNERVNITEQQLAKYRGVLQCTAKALIAALQEKHFETTSSQSTF